MEPPVVPRFIQALEAAGAAATRVPAYLTTLGLPGPECCTAEAQLLQQGHIHAIAFSSTAEVRMGGGAPDGGESRVPVQSEVLLRPGVASVLVVQAFYKVAPSCITPECVAARYPGGAATCLARTPLAVAPSTGSATE